ncbi:UDP-glucose--hexose-1-phosphate uridylyltransferase [Petrocella sp. FN5]|uniref:UDP-glucose--hexose-1-phosphate uridylyltransferase n=1 Tax=Petrocella sp. FN5 TaxID=3032002 RepID=UPI0023DC4254|nr:UDP-glucose--hexose-1-phosphate uridylyltransferase [Petrocella sp. FN5]MDF1618002.1 UDP-glucose--hexose-1-phosphate uridylyltransferase [Petrocella sp. FN5]
MEMIKKYIEELILFGLQHKMIEALDIPLVRNQLLALLNVSEPYEGKVVYMEDEMPTRILEKIENEAVLLGVIEESVVEREILDAKIMATLMPRQSELNRLYNRIKDEKGGKAATDYYYHLSQMSNYIRTDRIALNKYWQAETQYGNMEITINLSKPEKDPKDIEKAKHQPQSNYPKCFLCLENVGYEGNLNHPARSNHRVLPLKLNDESWYLQYSPYVYYNEHAIIFKETHEPMKINLQTFKRLADFVESMPHYFIGSNADLPIVGGSILSHDHFQGGRHRFPMVDAKVLSTYGRTDVPGIRLEMLSWPLSVVRLSSIDKSVLVQQAYEIFKHWQSYNDPHVDVLAYTETKEGIVPHNTVTPIARINDKGWYEMDLALRNNRKDEEHPDGIFHPHSHLHHIKKENIGLIEVMGLAVLPARLDLDLSDLREVLMGKHSMDLVREKYPHHFTWFESITQDVGFTCNEATAKQILEQAVGRRFAQVLDCSGVFKQSEVGLAAFGTFIESMGYLETD